MAINILARISEKRGVNSKIVITEEKAFPEKKGNYPVEALSTEHVYCSTVNAVDGKGMPVKEKWGEFWLPLYFMYILHISYLRTKGIKYERPDKMFAQLFKSDKRYENTDFRDLTNRVVNHINNNIAKDFEYLRIDKDLLIMPGISATSGIDINYSILASPEAIRKYHIDMGWQSIYKEEAKCKYLYSVAKVKPSDNKLTALNSNNTSQVSTETVEWNTALISAAVKYDNNRNSRVEPALLPEVDVDGSRFTTLSDFTCNYLINHPQFSVENCFTVIEGVAGSGKTYSVRYGAARLIEQGHTPVMVDLGSVFSKGTGSLVNHLCNYINGNFGSDELHTLWGGLRKADKKSKVVIFMEGLENIYPGKYMTLAAEMNTLHTIGNDNVYMILIARNAEDFLSYSGILNYSEGFERCLHARICSGDDTKTPLAASVLREYRAIRGEADRDPQRFAGLSEYTGVEPSIFITNECELNLIKVLSEIIIAKESVSGQNSVWYDFIIPSIAYKVLCVGKDEFTVAVVSEVLEEASEKSIIFEWAYEQIIDRFPEFRVMTPNYIMSTVIGMGFVVRSQNGCFKFADQSVCSYLAARFAAQVFFDGSSKGLRKAVIEQALDLTSDSNSNSLSFAEYGMRLIDELLPSCSSSDSFDPQVFRLAANVSKLGCMGVRKKASEMCSVITRHLKRRYLFYSVRRNKLPALNDPSNIESLITINQYAVFSKSGHRRGDSQWEQLNDIGNDLNSAAGSIMFDIFQKLDNKKLFDQVYVMSGEEWNDSFSILILEQLITILDEDHEISSYKYELELANRIYKEIESVNEEKASDLTMKAESHIASESTKYHETARRIHELRERILELI